MKLQLDSDDFAKWAATHIKIVVPGSLMAASWLLAQKTGGGTFAEVWYGIMSVVSGVAAVVTGVVYIGSLFE